MRDPRIEQTPVDKLLDEIQRLRDELSHEKEKYQWTLKRLNVWRRFKWMVQQRELIGYEIENVKELEDLGELS